MLGQHLIKSWSSTQTSVSLSSGESEFYGVVKAAGVSLGYQALLRDLGYSLSARVWTDSTATIGICGRQGLGKLRHIDTQCLWIQQRVRDRSIELFKVRGEVNPADLFTKHLSSNDRIQSLLAQFGCSYESGRAAGAPLLRKDAGTSKGESLCNMAANPNASQRRQIQDASAARIIWDGRQFPISSLDGIDLPDAFVHEEGLLPHLHENFAEIFPKAQACERQGDEDPADDTGLEELGTRLGMAPEKTKDAVTISSDPRQAWEAPRSTASKTMTRSTMDSPVCCLLTETSSVSILPLWGSAESSSNNRQIHSSIPPFCNRSHGSDSSIHSSSNEYAEHVDMRTQSRSELCAASFIIKSVCAFSSAPCSAASCRRNGCHCNTRPSDTR